MVCGTEKLVRKLAKGYEHRSGSAAYIAWSDMQNFISELIKGFSGICIGLRRDRGAGVSLFVLSAKTREQLYFVLVRNTNARGADRKKIKYELFNDLLVQNDEFSKPVLSIF